MNFGTWQVKASGGRYYLQREELPRVDKIKWVSYDKPYDSSNKEEVYLLKKRLNATYEAKKKKAEDQYDVENSYYSPRLRDAFRLERSNHITSRDHLISVVANVRHSFSFFAVKQKLPNPGQWPEKQYEFGAKLLKDGYSLSTIQKIQINTNQYIEFLNKTMPDEVPKVELELVATAKRKMIVAEKELQSDKRRFITETEFNIIRRYGQDIFQHISLAYHFGLRRSEVLGLNLEDVFEDYLFVQRQLGSLGKDGPKFSPLKGRERRKTPYWSVGPDLAYEWIERMQAMHPDTLSDRFAIAVKRANQYEDLDLTCGFHDLRHTYITNQVKKQSIFDVAKAVGHKDIRTTQEYLEDDREFSDRKFVPKRKTT